MNIHPLKAFTDNYIWVIEDDATFICVDPGLAAPVLQYQKQSQKRLNAILITHHHFDHIGGLFELKKAVPKARVYAPDDDRIDLIDQKVYDGDVINLFNHEFLILFIPGHTASHIAYYASSLKALFCGDTLFSAGCGRVFDGTITDLYHSLEKIKKLPPDTRVFCAHEYTRANLEFAHAVEPANLDVINYLNHIKENKTTITLPSTIKQELAINPFLRLNEPSIKDISEIKTPEKIFETLRAMKNNFKI